MFNITIFPDASLYKDFFTADDIPAIKKHKSEQIAINTVGQPIQCTSLAEVLKYAVLNTTVFSRLRDNRRSAANFISTNLACIDIDEDVTIEQAVSILNKDNIAFAMYASYSHTLEGRDKFHVIIPLSSTITSVDAYKATYKAICKLFDSKNDGQTCSPASPFFNSSDLRPFELEGPGNPFTTVEVQEQPEIVDASPALNSSVAKLGIGALSPRTMAFLLSEDEHSESGKWHYEFNLAAKNLKAAGFTPKEAEIKLRKVTGNLTPTDLYQLDRAYKDATFEYTPMAVRDHVHPLRMQYLTDQGKKIDIPVRQVVKTWFVDNKVDIHVNDQIYVTGNYLPVDAVVEDIRHFSESELKQKTSMEHIGSVISRMMIDSREKRLKELRDYVKFDPNKIVSLDKLMSAICITPSSEIQAVFKHFLWQAKRKLFGKTVTYHMMPVFIGKSGSGKSVFISKLLEPLKDVSYMDGDFKKLVDTREAFTLIKNFVYFMDEMAKADSADVESIKNKITSSIIQYRKLGTNMSISGPNNVVFIGASNTELQYIVKDPTSSRRFFQIVTPDRMDWETVDEFDYLSLWQSIDENQEIPYIKELLPRIEELQATMKYKPPVEQFVLALDICLEQKTDKHVPVSTRKLYEEYRIWAPDNGYKHEQAYHNFLNSVKLLIGEPQRHKNRGEGQFGYYILKENEQSHLTIIK